VCGIGSCVPWDISPITYAIKSGASFDQWYNTVANLNIELPGELSLVETPPGSGVSVFDTNAFFPIDNQGFGNTPGQQHNYHFTTEIHVKFTYQAGQTFTFRGDDDFQAKPDDSVRLFVRAGAIIPEAPVVQSTRDVPDGPLTLTVWPGPDCSGSVYVDDGESFAYLTGKSRRLSLSCEKSDTSLSLQSASVGEYAPWWKELRIVLHEVPKPPASVTDASGAKLQHSYDAAKKTLVVSVPGGLTDFKLTATW